MVVVLPTHRVVLLGLGLSGAPGGFVCTFGGYELRGVHLHQGGLVDVGGSGCEGVCEVDGGEIRARRLNQLVIHKST